MTNYVCDYQADYEQCLPFLTFKVLLNFAEVPKPYHPSMTASEQS